MSTLEEIKIEQDFILLRVQNDTDEVQHIEKQVRTGLIQFHFNLNSIPFRFNFNSIKFNSITYGSSPFVIVKRNRIRGGMASKLKTFKWNWN